MLLLCLLFTSVATAPAFCHTPTAFARVVPASPAILFATPGEKTPKNSSQTPPVQGLLDSEMKLTPLQGYPGQPMFVIPGGPGMVPTTMAGPGAGHPAHLIGNIGFLKGLLGGG